MDKAAILARLAEIETELAGNVDEAKIKALQDEVSKLTADLKAIEDSETAAEQVEAQRSAAKSAIAQAIKSATVNTHKNVNDAKAHRRSALKSIMGITLDPVEKRAFSTGASSAGAVVPTYTAEEIVTATGGKSDILNYVNIMHVPGGVKIPVLNAATAGIHTENGTIADSTDTITSVQLTGFEVCKQYPMSAALIASTPDNFENLMMDNLLALVTDACGDYIVSGTGSSQPTGLNAETWTTTGANQNAISVARTSSTTIANIMGVIGLLPARHLKRAKFIMSSNTYFADVTALSVGSNQGFTTQSDGTCYILGYEVIFSDSVAAHEMYFGDTKKIAVNFAEDIGIKGGYQAGSNNYLYNGVCVMDAVLTDKTAIVKLVKATA